MNTSYYVGIDANEQLTVSLSEEEAFAVSVSQTILRVDAVVDLLIADHQARRAFMDRAKRVYGFPTTT